MISVCIPIHNYHVVPLARSIAHQAKEAECEVELVCIDDGSEADCIERNRPIEDLGRYIVLGQNVGRAAVRNLLMQKASGDYLLYLDDDCIVPEGFIARYSEVLRKGPDVVVGGRVYDARFDDREHRLRYTYGIKIECRKAEERCSDPYRSFMTNNFMIKRSVMERVRFDERLTGYGHEDTLFGYRLRQEGVGIEHIDNPVTNSDVEENALFLAKSEEAVRSLAQIYKMMNDDKEFCQSVRLLRAYEKTKPLHRMLKIMFGCSRNCLKRKFERGQCASMTLFSFYKLGILLNSVTDRGQQ